MKELKLGIELDSGIITDYYFDNYIIEGLYFTGDAEKVILNCKNFNITPDEPTEGMPMTTKVSEFEHIVIITFYIDNKNQAQYLVDADLSLKELNEIPNNEMQLADKDIIRDAFLLF